MLRYGAEHSIYRHCFGTVGKSLKRISFDGIARHEIGRKDLWRVHFAAEVVNPDYRSDHFFRHHDDR